MSISARVTSTVKTADKVEYVIEVKTNHKEYVVHRRYSDFETLYKAVKPKLPPKDCPKFPRKHLVFNETDATLNERSEAFNAILSAVCEAKFFQGDIFEWAGPFLDPDLVGEDYRQSPRSAPGTVARECVDR